MHSCTLESLMNGRFHMLRVSREWICTLHLIGCADTYTAAECRWQGQPGVDRYTAHNCAYRRSSTITPNPACKRLWHSPTHVHSPTHLIPNTQQVNLRWHSPTHVHSPTHLIHNRSTYFGTALHTYTALHT
jgi:hypothetical protein